ncbi:tetratricopeptide repeat protein [Embleya sp. NPDC008237]|uniref:tetratricopeptide repeat protein n=1 Tax=Embleya sp. NPDC008237 TaxID=3363978 RepID=UPI0036EDFD5B
MEVTRSGGAEAHGGGTAVSGYRGPATAAATSGPGPLHTSVNRSGDAVADRGGVAVSGHVGQLNVHPPPPEPVEWPVRLGAVPALATAFQDRAGLRAEVDAAREGHATVVLAQVLSGGGGVGKSQLAAWYAHRALAEGVELVVWADATDPGQVVAVYAQAAHLVRAPGAGGQDAEADARAFTAWLATTRRSWLIVLDDVTDPDGITGWWPPPSPAGTGRVLATTRLRDPRLSGGGRAVLDVATYTDSEAETYLRDRLAHAGAAHLLDPCHNALTTELGMLPLALAHASAYMIAQDIGCADYLARFRDHRARLDKLLPRTGDTEGYGRQVAAALLLALDAADRDEPEGLAVPAVRLAACLDPAGHPRELWATTPVLDHLATHRTRRPPADTPNDDGAGEGVDAAQARAAVRLLHRYNLLTDNAAAGPRAVRIHALTARAARETTPPADTGTIARTAAAALLGLWPDADHTRPQLTTALRSNTDILARHTADHLWHPDGHPLLYHAGQSLLAWGLHATATTHWQHIAAEAERVLGAEHPDTLAARGGLAVSYWQAGRTGEALILMERVAAEFERVLGAEHPDTLRAWGNLAVSYWQAGRTGEAIPIEERVVAVRERVLGAEDPDTLKAWRNLAGSYRQAGRTGEAILLLERVTGERERLLGAEHPDTLEAWAQLAVSYQQAGRTGEAILLLERVTGERERLLGAEHPDTLKAWRNLAGSYRQAGRTGEAIPLLERVTAETERLLGAGHPDTLEAWAQLAVSYRQAGRTGEAITIQERVAEARSLHE